ncbi:MAG: AMP nucleosidase, partial [Balneolaceae bacterium]
MDKRFEFKKNKTTTQSQLKKVIEKACDIMEKIYDEGDYPKLMVKRSWSKHNPIITGEIAIPNAYRWYLTRELFKLADKGAEIKVFPSRPRVEMDDPMLFEAADEDDWDITQKKLFLFSPERIDLSLNRLEHYTGTRAKDFQRNILFTNYNMHVDVFKEKYPDCRKPVNSVQMPAYHHILPDNKGITLINIGVGPSNAKTISDHIAVLRPDVIVMVGHCGGLRNHQEIGDFVLATGFMRADG